jgi:hypothetical protein
LGSLLVRGIENFLYPVLVKDRLKVPPVSIFVSLVGGLFLFGWSGLVLGPVILTVTNALLGICAKRFGEPQVGPTSQDSRRTEPNESAAAERIWAGGVAGLPLEGSIGRHPDH